MITVINRKQIIKYLVGLIMIVGIIVGTARFFMENAVQQDIESSAQTISTSAQQFADEVENSGFLSCIDTSIPMIKNTKEDISSHQQTTSRGSTLQRVLNIQLGMMENVKELDDQDNPITDTTLEETIQHAQTGVSTQVITEKNITPRSTNTYGSVQIKNESNRTLTQDMIVPDFELSNKKDIIIFHTHSCESYDPSEQYNYTMTGNYRTTDLNFTVVRVGTELENYLKNYGYNIIHDTSYHDYPSYNGSYNSSLETVGNILKQNSGIQIAFDLHRDAIGNDNSYGPTVKIGDEVVAQIEFVIGTDGNGLPHPNWTQNLKTAIKIQEKANELYPGLFRPIIVRNSRFNQQLAPGATIIEVGATGNTMEQCLASMKYLAKVIDEVLK